MVVSKRQRLEAAIAGELADRPPVALWRHFPVDDQDPASLALSVVAFQRQFDFDFVKVTPASSFCLKDWGSEDRWEGAAEGTRAYTKRVIETVSDWADLPALPAEEGHLGQQLECLEAVIADLGPEVPVLQTVFSPLSQAKNLAGQDRLMAHLHEDPDRVADGLATILDTTISFVEGVIERGAAGIFYAVQHASYQMMDRATYSRLGEPADRAIMEAANPLWLNVLHLHGYHLMFDLAESLPAHVVNWHDRNAGPSLPVAAGRLSGAVCGGLRRHRSLVLSDPASIADEARDALRSMGGKGMILGAGCVVPILAPRANLAAARSAVDDFA
jgi:uroporphyrinogen decarboxylase